MFARDRAVLRPLPIVALALIAWLAPAPATRGAETVTIGDLTFVNQALVGVGRLPSDLRDKFGETFGSGSAIAVDPKSWLRTAAGYQGTFYMLPDRGYNVTGTSDYRARINKLFITFKPLDDPMAIPVGERQTSVEATLTDTILLTDAAGQSLTGLDPDGIRRAANGLPDLPQASNGHVSIDSESLALLPISIVVAQHMPPTFTRLFAERVNRLTDYTVKEADDGESIARGTGYIAPGGPKPSCPNARARISSAPIIPVRVPRRRSRRTRTLAARTTKVSKV